MTWRSSLDRVRSSREPVLEVRPPLDAPAGVALLAGSFDPPTIAHLALARAALARAERVVLVYSVRTLQKEGPVPGEPLLDHVARVAAMEAVAGQDARFSVAVASHGLLADQARAARALWPAAHLFLAMGSDKVLQLLDPRWYPDRDAAVDRLLDEATVLYAIRSGDLGRTEATLAAFPRWRDRFVRLDVDPEVAAVSSRLVRERLRAGQEVGPLVPDAVRGLLPQITPTV